MYSTLSYSNVTDDHRHHHSESPRQAQRYLPTDDCRLQSALDAIEKNHARVVIITGAGKAFCAGMDLDMLAAIATPIPAGKSGRLPPHGQTVPPHLEFFQARLIAAVNGARLAGGCGIATLCDFTLAVPEAKFGYTEVKIGFLPAIVSVFLTRQIGDKRARDLLLTGRIIDAEEAKRVRPGHRNCPCRPSAIPRSRIRRRPHRRQPQQPYPRQASAHLRGCRRHRRRPRTRHPRKRPHPLHRRLQGRRRLVPRKTQTVWQGKPE